MDVATYLPHRQHARKSPPSTLRAPYRDWRGHRDHVSLFDQQLAGSVAQLSDLGFGDRAARAQLRNRPAEHVSTRAPGQGASEAEAYLSRSLMVDRVW